MQTPRSPFNKVGGLVYFARMLSKIRLSASGQLREDFHKNLEVASMSLHALLHVEYPKLVARVLQGGTDEEILQWCFQSGGR